MYEFYSYFHQLSKLKNIFIDSKLLKLDKKYSPHTNDREKNKVFAQRSEIMLTDKFCN